jgi:hypothetical protein
MASFEAAECPIYYKQISNANHDKVESFQNLGCKLSFDQMSEALRN